MAGRRAAIYCVVIALLSSHSNAQDLRGRIEAEQQYYYLDAVDENQHVRYWSINLEAEMSWMSSSEKDYFSFIPFFRYDSQDEERSHGDIRELLWNYVGEHFESKVGINKVFWGVTESQHLVDIVNQTDFVESIDGEEKLGQPMINFSFSRSWGITDVFILPYFRDRTFSGEDGRFYLGVDMTNVQVNLDDPLFESSREKKHLDLALRWSRAFDDSDVALSYFDGTARDPLVRFDPASNAVRTFYPQMKRVGAEFQYNIGDWILKLEAIAEQQKTVNYSAAVAGFEYTLYGAYSSTADIGLLFEYSYDTRGFKSSQPATNTAVFQNDTFVGVRTAFNDLGSATILAGLILDHDNHGKSWLIEAGRRVGDAFKVNFEARGFEKIDPSDSLYAIRDDGFVELEIAWFF